MNELKSTLNLRLGPDANVSLTLTRVINTDDLVAEAHDVGASMRLLSLAWAHGYDDVEVEE